MPPKTSSATLTLDGFRRIGQSHLQAAKEVLDKVSVTTPRRGQKDPAILPATVAYLAHVALECVMKARLLSRGDCATATDLERKAPKVHRELFRGKSGHSLSTLAKQLRLKAILGDDAAILVHDACWSRMQHTERPYSLRYGAESLNRGEVGEELERAAKITAALIRDMPSVRRQKKGGSR